MDSMPFSSSDLVALSPEIILTIGAMVVLLWGSFDSARQKPGNFAYISLASVLSAAAALWLWVSPLAASGVTTAFSNQLAVDGFGTFFSAIFLLTAALAILASTRFLDDAKAHHPEYYFLMLTALIGMLIMARGADLISLFVGLELQALSVYVMVGYLKGDRRSAEGGLKYFILGGLSSGIFIYALSLLYAVTGVTALDALAATLGDGALAANPILMIALLLLLVALAFKVAAVPFHLWAPDAYSGAPTPVALFISVASKGAAFAMMLRILYSGLGPLAPSWAAVLAVISAITMTFGNVAALSQTNIKRMLAYSSIAHAGYALIGVVAGGETGLAATLFYLFAYTFMNVGAWGTIMLLRRDGLAGDQIDDFAGLGQRSYWAAGAMLLFLLSLGGIPPTIGFLGKWYLFGAAIGAGWGWLALIGALNAAASLYYYLRIVVAMLIREPEDNVTLVNSTPLNLTLAISAVMTVLGLLWATPFLEWAQWATLSF